MTSDPQPPIPDPDVVDVDRWKPSSTRNPKEPPNDRPDP